MDFNLVKRFISVFGSLLLFYWGSVFIISKSPASVEGLSGSLMATLITFAVLAPVVLLVVAIAQFTRKRSKEIPGKYRFFYDISQDAYVNKEKKYPPRPIIKSENTKLRGMFTFFGVMQLTDAYLLIAQKTGNVSQTSFTAKPAEISGMLPSRFSNDDLFDACLFGLSEIKSVGEEKDLGSRYLCIETKDGGKFCFKSSDPKDWVAKINPLLPG